MTQLLDLPDEVLIEIAREVLGSDQGDWGMIGFRLVNRRLLHISDQIWHRGLRISKRRRCSFGAQFAAFADYMARHADRRDSVRAMDVSLPGNAGWGMGIEPGTSFDGLRRVAPRFFEASLSAMWRANGVIRFYPHVAALLSILPRVEVLVFDVERYDGKPYVDRGEFDEVVRLGQVGQGPFSSVKELTCKGPTYESYGTLLLSTLPSLLKFPSLKILTLKNVDVMGYYASMSRGTQYPGPTARSDLASKWYEKACLSVERLNVWECTMEDEYMRQLIAACRRLTHFSYEEWLGTMDMQSDHVENRAKHLDVEGWHRALSMHEKSIVEITLNCTSLQCVQHHHDDSRVGTYAPLPVWPCFKAFHELRVLEIEHRRMKYDHLPRGLQRLRLFDFRHKANDAEVDSWKSIKADYCPDIEQVEIQVTLGCRAVQRRLKYSGYRWRSYSDRIRVWDKGGFRLSVWFKYYDDWWRVVPFTDGPDDTGSVNSDGVKIDISSSDTDWGAVIHSEESTCEEEYEEDEDWDSIENDTVQDWDEQELQAYQQYKEDVLKRTGSDTLYGEWAADSELTEDDKGYEAEDSSGDSDHLD